MAKHRAFAFSLVLLIIAIAGLLLYKRWRSIKEEFATFIYSAFSVTSRGSCFDSAGNLYIADTNNNKILKVTASTGIITTIAGTGTASFSGDGGLATNATLKKPYSVVVDTSGNIYIADTQNNRIRMIPASITSAFEVIVNGNRTTDVVAGNIYTIFGNGLTGVDQIQLLDRNKPRDPLTVVCATPQYINIDQYQNIFCSCDYSIHMLVANSTTNPYPTLIDPITLGKVYRILGANGLGGESAKANQTCPETNTGFYIDSSGNLYYNQQINNSGIYKITASTGIAAKIYGGNLGQAQDKFGTITDVKDNTPVSPTTAVFSYLWGIVRDASGNLFVADTNNCRIRMIAATTTSPFPVIIGGSSTNTVTAGNIYTIAGDGTQGNTGDGVPATSAKLNAPYGITFDIYGNIFITDTGNNKVRMIAKGTTNPFPTIFTNPIVPGNIYSLEINTTVECPPNTQSCTSLTNYICATGYSNTGTACVPCARGYSNTGTSCVSCPAGYYCSGTSNTPCGSNTANPNTGSSNVSACVSCGAGFYSGLGSSQCTACTSNAASCTSATSFICRPGYSNSGTECVPCAPGYSNTGTSCVLCPAGYYCSGTVNTPCGSNTRNPNTGSSNVSACISCGAGYYSGLGSIQCTQCAGNAASCTSDISFICAPGFSNNGTSCIPCPAGWICSGTENIPCGSNTRNPNTGSSNVSACISCGAGFYSGLGSSQCETCTVNSASCTSATSFTCRPGYSNSGTSCVSCPAGYYCSGTSNTPCGTGTANPNTGSSNVSACISCGAGYYSGVGASQCETCTSNAASCTSATSFTCGPGYSNTGTSCVSCPAGYYCSGTSNTPCGTGTANPNTGSSVASVCAVCGEGYYSGLGARQCTACVANSSSCRDATSFTCSRGYYSNAGGCSNCLPNTYSCTSPTSFECSAGFYANAGACSSCPPNSTCRAGGIDSSRRGLTSFTCAAGSYSNAGGCTSCPSNSTCFAGGVDSSRTGLASFTCEDDYYPNAGICKANPLNCIVSPWSPCSSTACGTNGIQTRTVTRSNANDGMACPPLTQNCTNPPCTLVSPNFYNTVLGLYKYNPVLGNYSKFGPGHQ